MAERAAHLVDEVLPFVAVRQWVLTFPYHLWASLMRRSFGFDVLGCQRCGGRFQLIARIDQVPVIQRILGHLGLATVVPAVALPRAPPLPLDDPVSDDAIVAD